MAFDPKPGQRISINNAEIEFTGIDSSGHGAEFVYAEIGREATVYLVRKAGVPYALKVFHPNYQDERLIRNSLKINQFSKIDGLRVAGRDVITKQANSKLINNFPELEYAILMPWVKGAVWGNIIANKDLTDGQRLFRIAKSFINVVCNLETNGWAHCDLSNNNFIIDPSALLIELIDIEDMFAPDMPRPVPEISFGTPGYRNSWIAENGLWGPSSDRFASAILCAEILTWCFSEIRENMGGDGTYFDEADIGQENKRYALMKKYLGTIEPALADLFERVWFSARPEECPRVCEWKNVLNQIGTVTTGNEPSPLEKKKHITDVPDNIHENLNYDYVDAPTILRGTPARMEVSRSSLDFGMITSPNISASFTISNPGGGMLTGNITSEGWLEVQPAKFEIAPSTNSEFHVSLRNALPQPQSKYEYRTPSAIFIESNTGVEVIGAMFTLPKKSFFG